MSPPCRLSCTDRRADPAQQGPRLRRRAGTHSDTGPPGPAIGSRTRLQIGRLCPAGRPAGHSCRRTRPARTGPGASSSTRTALRVEALHGPCEREARIRQSRSAVRGPPATRTVAPRSGQCGPQGAVRVGLRFTEFMAVRSRSDFGIARLPMPGGDSESLTNVQTERITRWARGRREFQVKRRPVNIDYAQLDGHSENVQCNERSSGR